jgi:hypothetical protein
MAEFFAEWMVSNVQQAVQQLSGAVYEMIATIRGVLGTQA